MYVGEVAIFILTGSFVGNVLFKVWWDFIFGVHKNGYKGIVPLKITCTLACQRILLNCSLRPWMYWKETKIILLTSKPLSGFSVGVAGSFPGF